jgi:hypothetical protein
MICWRCECDGYPKLKVVRRFSVERRQAALPAFSVDHLRSRRDLVSDLPLEHLTVSHHHGLFDPILLILANGLDHCRLAAADQLNLGGISQDVKKDHITH